MRKQTRHFKNPWVGIVMGTLLAALGLYVLVFTAGDRTATIGISGALGLPIWVMGAVLLILALALIYGAVRQVVTDRSSR
jgi:tellurite resistance protein TehA-like permease